MTSETNPSPALVEAPTPTPIPAPGPRPRRLLVVDDAIFMRKLIRDVASAAGWAVFEAPNGAEAVTLYREHRPDLVTMDVVMPVMNGLDALRRIRIVDPDARVVMVTALDQKATLMEAIREGAHDFIVKPFDRERIIGLLQKVGETLGAEGPPPTDGIGDSGEHT